MNSSQECHLSITYNVRLKGYLLELDMRHVIHCRCIWVVRMTRVYAITSCQGPVCHSIIPRTYMPFNNARHRVYAINKCHSCPQTFLWPDVMLFWGAQHNYKKVVKVIIGTTKQIGVPFGESLVCPGCYISNLSWIHL